MADSKKAKFYCEGCGSEVASNARMCPKCGRFFAAVRCPKCGKVGTVRDFKAGCPRCHYAMTEEDIYGKPANEEPDYGTLDGRKHSLSRKSKRQIKEAFRKWTPSIGDDVPRWLFFVCLALLILIMAVLFIRCN